MILRWHLLPSFLLFALSAKAQDGIGTDICDCSPGRYRIILDFGQPACTAQGFNIAGAVDSTECLVSKVFNDPSVVDLVPVTIEEVEIFELKQDLSIEAFSLSVGPFTEGAAIEYTSRTIDAPETIFDAGTVTKALKIDAYGQNQFQQEIFVAVEIRFSNDCSVYPVLAGGEKIGWFRLEPIEHPPDTFCPLAGDVVIMPTLPPASTPMSMSMSFRRLEVEDLDKMDWEEELGEFGTVRKAMTASSPQTGKRPYSVSRNRKDA